jgi:uncharacterized membrane protein YkvA (DUF1232 family)
MIAALNEHIKNLAGDPGDQFHTHVRRRLGKKGSEVLEERIRQYILTLPFIINRVYHYWSSPEVPSDIKKVSGFLLAYLYNPRDFLSEEEKGLFGFLDDAYFTFLIYDEIMNTLKNKGVVISGDDLHALEKVTGFRENVEKVIPDECKKIQEIIESLKTGQTEGFNASFR